MKLRTRVARRFARWYWSADSDQYNDLLDWVEDRMGSESLANRLTARWDCALTGPEIVPDQCGIPEHDYCGKCNGLCEGLTP